MNKRQEQIVVLLKNAGYISVVEAAKQLNVTEMTIRRDLKFLESMSLLTRIHGGAMQNSNRDSNIVVTEETEKQCLIAKLTVDMLKPNSTVILNVGRTVLAVAKEIAKKELHLTVVTNSLEVATVLYKSDCEVLLTGGTLRRTGMDLVGPITEKNLEEYYIDTLIAGCDAANSKQGFFTSDINLAEIEKKCVEIAGKVIIVSESNKFKRLSMVKFVNVNQVSTFITDNKISTTDRKNLQNAGVKVIN